MLINLGSKDTLQLGERAINDLANLITVGGQLTSGARTTLRLPNASSGYAVTAGKTFTVVGCTIVNGSATSALLSLAQTDNDVGQDSATAFTNPVYLYGSVNYLFYRNGSQGGTAPNVGQPSSFFLPKFQIAATKFISINQGSGSAATIFVQIHGYEA